MVPTSGTNVSIGGGKARIVVCQLPEKKEEEEEGDAKAEAWLLT